MRIDKYLKITRLIKRRTVAKQLLDKDIFYLNGKIAKPSSNIKVNDIIDLTLGKHFLKVKVLKTERTSNKEDCSSLYQIMEEKILDDKN